MPATAPTTAPVPFLEVTDLHKRFGGVHALRGVSLALMPGQIYHLLGTNGCGKSTLIKIVSGAQPPSSGEIRIQGTAFAQLTALQAMEQGIETVYQDLSLIPNLSVAENIGLGRQLMASGGALARWLDRRAMRECATQALQSVGMTVDARLLQTPVEQLPVASRQLVAIARAVAARARLVIMDEPTTALTQREVDRLIAVIDRLRADGVCVLFVSHKLDECYAIGGHVIVMRDGALVAQGPISDFSKAQLVQQMTGQHVSEERLRSGSPGDAVRLEVRDLGRSGRFQGVRFAVRAGEILGITGLLDSGRNELAMALAGVVPADHGTVLIDGQPVALQQPADAHAHGIAYVPEDRIGEGLFLDKSIRDNVVVSVLDRVQHPWGGLDGAAARTQAETTVRELQIRAPDVLLPVQSLSGGNQQRVLIGRWLATDPRVLILHGPTVGVDVGSKDIIFRIVQKLAEQGMALIVISDDLPELLQNCDRILLMRDGGVEQSFDAATTDESTLARALVTPLAERQVSTGTASGTGTGGVPAGVVAEPHPAAAHPGNPGNPGGAATATVGAGAGSVSATAPAPRGRRPASGGGWLGRLLAQRPEWFTLMLIVAVVLVVSILNPAFLQWSTLFDILRSSTVTGLFALGVLVVLAAGGIDVSFTAIGVFCLYALTQLVQAVLPGLPFPIIALCGALMGAGFGLLNGWLVHTLKAPSLIVTIATQYLLRGALLTFLGTAFVTVLPATMDAFGQWGLVSVPAAGGATAVLPVSVLVWVAAALVTAVVLRQTLMGRAVYAMGGSLPIAERLGYPMQRLHLFVFGWAGLLAGLGGVVHGASIRLANPFDLVGTELDVIAAVILGGARITGGNGSVIGTMMGVLLVTLINNVLILVGVPSIWQKLVIGLFILIAGLSFARSRKAV